MSDLVTELENSMMRGGFGVDSSKYPIILGRRWDYDVCIFPNSRERTELGTGKSFGSALNFSLRGDVKEGVSEDQYRSDVLALKSRLNEEFNGNGISIGTFVCMPFNGRQEIKLSDLILYHKKETSPQAVANAVGLVQEQVYKLLRQYIQ